MKDMIGCCGLNCSKCAVYIATQTDDDGKKEEIALEWAQKHGGHFTADQMNCDGCQAEGRAPDWVPDMIFRLWMGYNCPLRKCCRDRGIQTCADCGDYGCSQLQEFCKDNPEMRSNLERLRG